MIKEAVKHFSDAGDSIVNIGSVNSLAAQAGMSVYLATKGATETEGIRTTDVMARHSSNM